MTTTMPATMESIPATNTVEVRRIVFADLDADPVFAPLVSEYTDECQLSGMPRCKYNADSYYRMEQAGMLHTAGAYIDGILVGFVSVLVCELPHYSRTFAVVESVFVGRDHRHTGAGIALIREMERIAAAGEAIGILVTAPCGGRLEALMPKIGYSHTNKVFFRSLQ